MTVSEALYSAARQLSAHSSSARLDAEVLLAHTLDWERSRLLAHGDELLSASQSETYSALIERRLHGEPIAYLTGHREFYGLDLLVTRDVLVPRPETESVVEACLQFVGKDEECLFADIGTGSGAIVVAVCKHRPHVRAWATDISTLAIPVAHENARRHGVAHQITFSVGDLLLPLPGPVNLISANLPYVTEGEASPEVALWEPKVAVFGGGDDGALLIRRFVRDAARYLLPGGRLVMETAYSQGSIVSNLAKSNFLQAQIEVRRDLAGYDRIVVIQT